MKPPKKLEVTDRERRFWLKKFSDYELAQIAVAFFGVSVSAETFTTQRLALLGSASQEEEK